MSTTDTEAPFAGKEAGVDCPNCGKPLFSGLADGGILICRDAEGGGCQLAVDPSNVDGLTLATNPTRMEDVVPSPVIGPPNEAAPSTVQDEQTVAAAHEPWTPPEFAPQTQNFDPEAVAAEAAPQTQNFDPEAVAAEAAPAVKPITPPPPPPPAQDGSGGGKDGTAT